MSKIFLASRAGVMLPKFFSEFGLVPSKLKCLFVTTASELANDLEYLENDRKAWREFGVNFEEYTVTGKSHSEVKSKLEGFDMVYVAGGNTYHLLYEAKNSGFIDLIKTFVTNGGCYVGSSAGAMIATKNIKYINSPGEDKLKIRLIDYEGIGFIDGEIYVHLGSKKRAHSKIQMFVNGYFTETKKIMLTENQGILVNDGWIKYLQA